MAFTPEMRAKSAATLHRKAEERRAERAAMAQGIGESKIFAAPEGTFPDNPVLDCRVGGVRVRDLPLEAQGRILYQQTDEGFAERNAGKVESAARVTAGPFDKAVEERRDFRANEMEPWMAKDPMKELIDAHIGPGMKGKFLSPSKCERDGTRGFKPVLVNGEPVKLGNMPLAEMPIELVERRNRTYRAKDAAALQQITEQFVTNQEREARDLMGPNDRSGAHRGSSIGVRSFRGNENEEK